MPAGSHGLTGKLTTAASCRTAPEDHMDPANQPQGLTLYSARKPSWRGTLSRQSRKPLYWSGNGDFFWAIIRVCRQPPHPSDQRMLAWM